MFDNILTLVALMLEVVNSGLVLPTSLLSIESLCFELRFRTLNVEIFLLIFALFLAYMTALLPFGN